VCDSTAPIAVPRQTFREWEGEARRVQTGIVWRRGRPSQRDAVLFTLLGGGPAYLYQRGCVLYRQRCMQTSGLAKTFPWAWSWNRDFVLGAQPRLGRSGYRGLL
jgi:hypothetical protein